MGVKGRGLGQRQASDSSGLAVFLSPCHCGEDKAERRRRAENLKVVIGERKIRTMKERSGSNLPHGAETKHAEEFSLFPIKLLFLLLNLLCIQSGSGLVFSRTGS